MSDKLWVFLLFGLLFLFGLLTQWINRKYPKPEDASCENIEAPEWNASDEVWIAYYQACGKTRSSVVQITIEDEPGYGVDPVSEMENADDKKPPFTKI